MTLFKKSNLALTPSECCDTFIVPPEFIVLINENVYNVAI